MGRFSRISLKLTANLSRPLSLRSSILGYVLMGSSLFAVIMFTVMTKGQVLVCKNAQHDGNKDDIAAFQNGNCSATTVFSGQTFTRTPDTTFEYSAATWANYSQPRNLSEFGCSLQDGGRIQVFGNPMSTPIINWELTYICHPSNVPPVSGSEIINSYNGVNLGVDDIVLQVKNLGKSDAANTTFVGFRDAVKAVRSATNVCADQNGKSLAGFEIYTNNQVAYMSDDPNYQPPAAQPCTDTSKQHSSNVYNQIIDLFTNTKQLIDKDFQNLLGPLPDVVFPCHPCTKEWDNAKDILWSIVVAAGATFGVIKAVTMFLLNLIEPQAEYMRLDSRERDVEAKAYGYSSPLFSSNSTNSYRSDDSTMQRMLSPKGAFAASPRRHDS